MLEQTMGQCSLCVGILVLRTLHTTPPTFVIATPKYGINTVATPTVAITRAWLAHDTYNYRRTRERMHGMSAPPAPGMGTVIG